MMIVFFNKSTSALLFFIVLINVIDLSDQKILDFFKICTPLKSNVCQILPRDCGRVKLAPSINQTRIAGGRHAKKGEFSSYAIIRSVAPGMKSLYSCGATIISDQHVLTAGHCVTPMMEKNDMNVTKTAYVITKIDIRPKPELTFESEKICRSEKFARLADNRIEHDLAVVKLQRKIKFNEYIQPACLIKETLAPNQQAFATGMGYQSSYIYDLSTWLQVLPVKKVNCPINVSKTNFCVKSNAPQLVGEICKGDSGSGIFYMSKEKRMILAGVVSFGYISNDSCAKGHNDPAFCSDLSYLRADIEEMLGRCR